MVLVAVAVGVACLLVDESEREKLWEQLGNDEALPDNFWEISSRCVHTGQ